MPVLIDIEVPSESPFLVVRRSDGSLTVSVDPCAAVEAVRQYLNANGAVARPIHSETMREPMN